MSEAKREPLFHISKRTDISFRFAQICAQRLLFPVFFCPFQTSQNPLLLLVYKSFDPRQTCTERCANDYVSIPANLQSHGFSGTSYDLIFEFSAGEFLLILLCFIHIHFVHSYLFICPHPLFIAFRNFYFLFRILSSIYSSISAARISIFSCVSGNA